MSLLRRKCSNCVHYKTTIVKKEKAVIERFNYGEEGNKKWNSRVKGKEIVEVPEYFCNYYHDMINDNDRALKCRRFKDIKQQTLLTTFVEGDTDLRLFSELFKNE